jgi:hypothetical protein
MAEPAAKKSKIDEDFYDAKEDGRVDIGDNYKGTGSGENTTLTADQFHQHGDVQVMQSWEAPYMNALAEALVKHLTTNKDALMAHGKISILEIGFGLGLSATHLQKELQGLVTEYGRELVEHHIVELNDAVFANLEKFAATEAEKGHAKVVPHKGNWKDVVQGLIGKEKFSGFLYDPFPTCKEEQHYHQLMFISDQHAGPLLHKGGAVVYCNLTSLGVLLADAGGDWDKVWTTTQKPYLLGQKMNVLDTEYSCTGFKEDSVSYSLFEITSDMKAKRTEQKCNYYGGDIHNHALVPVCVKP